MPEIVDCVTINGRWYVTMERAAEITGLAKTTIDKYCLETERRGAASGFPELFSVSLPKMRFVSLEDVNALAVNLNRAPYEPAGTREPTAEEIAAAVIKNRKQAKP